MVMHKKLTFWTDILIFLDILVVIFSGILIFSVLNKGIWLYTNFFLTRNQWNLVYSWSGILLIVLALIRVFLDFFTLQKRNNK